MSIRTSIVLRLAAVVVTCAVSACATTTTITTERPGATVVRQGDKEELGVTPLTYTSQAWLWQTEKLDVTDKRGKTATIEMKRSEVDMVPMAGGVCLSLTGCGAVAGIPLILAGGMKLPEETPVTFDDPKSGSKRSARGKKSGDVVSAADVNDGRGSTDEGATVAYAW